MIINEEFAKQIAFLARLGLSTAEIKKFSGQLDEIMIFFEKLQEVDTSDTEPFSQITGLSNIAREDIPHECILSSALLECSPMGTQGKHVRVQKAI